MSITTDIVYKSRRAGKFYLLVNGERVRVTPGMFTQVEFGYTGRPDDYWSMTSDGRYIYRDSDRVYTENGTPFYPYATETEAELFNAIVGVCSTHQN